MMEGKDLQAPLKKSKTRLLASSKDTEFGSTFTLRTALAISYSVSQLGTAKLYMEIGASTVFLCKWVLEADNFRYNATLKW